MDTTDTVPGLDWHRISWRTWLLALATLITFVAAAPQTVWQPYPRPIPVYEGASQPTPPMMGSSGVGGGSAPSAQSTVTNDSVMYPYPGDTTAPVTDTREFLKVNYDASMQTRSVPTLVRRVETVVRGYDGRVDGEQSSEKFGYVRFVVPQSQFENFRTELEGLVGSRFLTVSVNATNLLSQKQGIEGQAASASSTLAAAQSDRASLVSAHGSLAASLQSQISADNAQLADLREQVSNSEIEAQIQYLESDLASLKSRLANENASYATKLAAADAKITYAQKWVAAVANKDQTFLDDIATVDGMVSVRWMSLWEMAQAYLPGYSIPGILALCTLLSYLWDRRQARRVRVGRI